MRIEIISLAPASTFTEIDIIAEPNNVLEQKLLAAWRASSEVFNVKRECHGTALPIDSGPVTRVRYELVPRE